MVRSRSVSLANRTRLILNLQLKQEGRTRQEGRVVVGSILAVFWEPDQRGDAHQQSSQRLHQWNPDQQSRPKTPGPE